jgi:hypothetical protein
MNAKQENVETIYNETRTWRVTIFRRPDGTFGLEWEKYIDDEPAHPFWAPMRYGVTFCDTLETARREAHGRFAAKEFPKLRLD